jgi:hypothetical protein
MKTLLLYRANSDHERTVLDYIRDFKMQTGRDLETMEVDSPEGMEICRLYDIVEYPAILVRNDDGALQNMWSGGMLPRIGEVSYYVGGGHA